MSDARLIQSFQFIRQKHADEFRQHGRVSTYLRRNTAVVDQFVKLIAKREGLSPQTALVAVGGYGRREMFPYSDIDILVLLPADHDTKTDEATGRFVTALWNLGMTVGSSVRTQSEMLAAAKEDITVATAFLEARFLAGDKTLFKDARRTRFFPQQDARNAPAPSALRRHTLRS